MKRNASAVGLFAGIGGLETGFKRAGIESALLCEIEPAATCVLRKQFPGTEISSDVRVLKSLPSVDIVAAGFPCQDLSQAGQTAGIRGRQSRLVDEVFRLIAPPNPSPRWLVLENVSFMLQLDRGRAMRHVVRRLESLGFRWAYRVVDSRAFGVPQRRQRVVLVASKSDDPRRVLFADNCAEPEPVDHAGLACGFYWTEGTRGLGWAVDAVPTLKGGSTIGIPSPPAIWRPDGRIVTPHLCDAERLQGFAADWTLPAMDAGFRAGARWKLIGNAVTVPMAEWLGSRLVKPGKTLDLALREVGPKDRWPRAAWGSEEGKVYAVEASMWPVVKWRPHLAEFLTCEPALLSAKAAEGFLKRANKSSLRFVAGFLDAVAAHVRHMKMHRTAESGRAVA